jgi:hypothetical protein
MYMEVKSTGTTDQLVDTKPLDAQPLVQCSSSLKPGHYVVIYEPDVSQRGRKYISVVSTGRVERDNL